MTQTSKKKKKIDANYILFDVTKLPRYSNTYYCISGCNVVNADPYLHSINLRKGIAWRKAVWIIESLAIITAYRPIHSISISRRSHVHHFSSRTKNGVANRNILLAIIEIVSADFQQYESRKSSHSQDAEPVRRFPIFIHCNALKLFSCTTIISHWTEIYLDQIDLFVIVIVLSSKS